MHRGDGGANKKTLYAFERNIDDKEKMQAEKKKIAEVTLKYSSDRDTIILHSGSDIHYLP